MSVVADVLVLVGNFWASGLWRCPTERAAPGRFGERVLGMYWERSGFSLRTDSEGTTESGPRLAFLNADAVVWVFSWTSSAYLGSRKQELNSPLRTMPRLPPSIFFAC
ncbi:MAG: hypothetical protein LBJ70_04955 [Holosporales bacterium]|nr:hypothetical protein [Holosporales bacterium]